MAPIALCPHLTVCWHVICLSPTVLVVVNVRPALYILALLQFNGWSLYVLRQLDPCTWKNSTVSANIKFSV